VRLAGLDYGGEGPSVLLLHGLAGHAGECAETAQRPDLVRGLVVAAASPHGGDEAEVVKVDLVALGQALRRWPVPFASRDAAARSHWEEWERISCPSLVVRAGNGVLAPGDAQAMAARGQHARLVELAGAKHDLHLDRPAEWRQVLTEFVSALGTAAA
jgi:hypothetical protein